MRNNIFLIMITLLMSCNSNPKSADNDNSRTCVSNNHSSRGMYNEALEEEDRNLSPIDSAEFVNYWILFHKAIVSENIQLLSSLIKNELFGMGIENTSLSSLSELYENGFPLVFHDGKVSKDEFFKKLNNIFIPQFMELFKRYDLKKDLYKQPYFCLKRVQNKEYHIYTVFDDMANTVSLKMDFSDVSTDSSVGVEFLFSKDRDKKIKLFAVSCYTLSVSE